MCSVWEVLEKALYIVIYVRLIANVLVFMAGSAVIYLLFWSSDAQFGKSQGADCYALILRDTSIMATTLSWNPLHLTDYHGSFSCSLSNAIQEVGSSPCNFEAVERCGLVFENYDNSSTFSIWDGDSTSPVSLENCRVPMSTIFSETRKTIRSWLGNPEPTDAGPSLSQRVATFEPAFGTPRRAGSFFLLCMFVWLLLRLLDTYLFWTAVSGYYVPIAAALDTWVSTIGDLTGITDTEEERMNEPENQITWQNVADEFTENLVAARKSNPWILDWTEGCICGVYCSRILYMTKFYWLTILSYNLLEMASSMRFGKGSDNLVMWSQAAEGGQSWIGYNNNGGGPETSLGDGCPEIIGLNSNLTVLRLCCFAYPLALLVGIVMFFIVVARYQNEHPCHDCKGYEQLMSLTQWDTEDEASLASSDDDSLSDEGRRGMTRNQAHIRDEPESHGLRGEAEAVYGDIKHEINRRVTEIKSLPRHRPAWIGVTAFWATLILIGLVINSMVFFDNMARMRFTSWLNWIDWSYTFDFWIEWPKLTISVPSRIFVAFKVMTIILIVLDVICYICDFALGFLVRVGFVVYRPKQPYLFIIKQIVPEHVIDAIWPVQDAPEEGQYHVHHHMWPGDAGPGYGHLFYHVRPDFDSDTNGYAHSHDEIIGVEIKGWIKVDGKGYLPTELVDGTPAMAKLTEEDFDCLGFRRWRDESSRSDVPLDEESNPEAYAS